MRLIVTSVCPDIEFVLPSCIHLERHRETFIAVANSGNLVVMFVYSHGHDPVFTSYVMCKTHYSSCAALLGYTMSVRPMLENGRAMTNEELLSTIKTRKCTAH